MAPDFLRPFRDGGGFSGSFVLYNFVYKSVPASREESLPFASFWHPLALISCYMSLPSMAGLYGQKLGGCEQSCDGFLPLAVLFFVCCM